MSDIFKSSSWLVTMAAEWACQLNDMDHEWHKDAACKDIGPDLFFMNVGDNKQKITRAKEVCADCAVQKRCLQYAINNEILHGIWGGMTPDERRIKGMLDVQGVSNQRIEMVRMIRDLKAQGSRNYVIATCVHFGVSKATVRRAIEAVENYENEIGERIE